MYTLFFNHQLMEADMMFFIQTQAWPRARFRIGDRFTAYRSVEEAQDAINERRRIGWTCPMRIVNARLEVQKIREKCSA